MILKKKFQVNDNSVFGKTIEHVRKNRDTKLATTEKIRNYLVSLFM